LLQQLLHSQLTTKYYTVYALQTLVSTTLNTKYDSAVQDVTKRLHEQGIGVQLGTDGWKRKNVNNGQKLLNFIANFPDGGTSFLGVTDTQGASMDHLEFLRIMKEQIIALGERLGALSKVLGCITDREAAVQKAFHMLETEFHWMVNLVCQVNIAPAIAQLHTKFFCSCLLES